MAQGISLVAQGRSLVAQGRLFVAQGRLLLALRNFKDWGEFFPSGKGDTRSSPATPQRLLNPKWPTGSGNKLNSMLLNPQGAPKWPTGS